MANNLRDLLQPIIAEAVEKAVNGYRQMLLGEDAPAPKAKPGPKPGPKAAPSTKAPVPAVKPAAKKSKKFVRRDPKEIAATVAKVLAYVKEHPGLNSEAVVKGVGGDKTGVSDALARLRSSKKVKTTGIKRAMTYAVAEKSGGGAKAAGNGKAAPTAPKAAKKTKAPKKAPKAKVKKQAAKKAEAPAEKAPEKKAE